MFKESTIYRELSIAKALSVMHRERPGDSRRALTKLKLGGRKNNETEKSSLQQ